MLSSKNRLRSAADFSAVTRRGRRSRNGSFVAYLLASDVTEHDGGSYAAVPARAGLIVGKSVGNSVARHRVSRRLREQLRPQVERLRTGDRLVVRALPRTAEMSSAEFARDLQGVIRRLGRGEVTS